MKRIRIFCLVLIIAMTFIISLNVVSADNNVWELKLGTDMADNLESQSQGLRKFVELAEEKSKGKLKIDIYWSESLGIEKTQLENVINGIQDMYFESYSPYCSYVSDFAVHTTPYLFKTEEEYQKFLLSPIEKEMEEKLLQKTGIRFINENKNWFRIGRTVASIKPLLTLEDIKGIKMRQAPNQGSAGLWSLLGAEIIYITWSEAYLALQTGMANAITCGATNLHSDKFAEHVKYVAESHEYYQQLIVAMNDKKYQSLPEELKIALNEASNEAGDFFSQLVKKDNLNIKKILEKDYNVKYYEFPYEEVAKIAEEGVISELEKKGLITTGLIERILNYLK
ncbi:MAG TPA: TRAP transporter substrate-binding protein [Candidatus Paceibacterota bacterium]|nr:TRAP transporter substrate-binding protein [Candidatus Paceibacterota bacterium]